MLILNVKNVVAKLGGSEIILCFLWNFDSDVCVKVRENFPVKIL